MRTIPTLGITFILILMMLFVIVASGLLIFALIETIMKPKDIKILCIVILVTFPVPICALLCFICKTIINEYRVLRSYFQTKNDTINNNTVKRKNRSMYEYLGDRILTDIIIHGSV